jgi:myo-inositol-1(or 4)-monophosphatase
LKDPKIRSVYPQDYSVANNDFLMLSSSGRRLYTPLPMNHPFVNIATQAARAASRNILRFLDQLDQVQVTEKQRNDLVTDVDKMAEAEIIQHIRKAYPSHTILSEETGLQAGRDHQYCWVIDPLDGTANFVHGLPHFSISIAVKKGDQLEAACIYDPIRQELFTAAKGKGAQLNNKRIRVSDTIRLENALIGTGFPFKYEAIMPDYLNTFSNVLPKVTDIRRAGAASLDLAYVACGRLDGFWEPALKEWDFAAGALLIQEAGGVVSDFANTKGFLSSGNIIAANPKLHSALQKLL